MKIILKNGENELPLDQFIEFIQSKVNEQYRNNFKNLTAPEITYELGRKFVRIVTSRHGDQRSVYCFLDSEGNIYKAASWKAPAKHIRGSVFDKDHGWGKSLNLYGATYLR